MPSKSKWTGRHYSASLSWTLIITSDLSMVDINEMKCWELVKELKSRGLPSSGNKNELINHVESRACATPHSSVAALQRAVDQAWSDLLTVEHV